MENLNRDRTKLGKRDILENIHRRHYDVTRLARIDQRTYIYRFITLKKTYMPRCDASWLPTKLINKLTVTNLMNACRHSVYIFIFQVLSLQLLLEPSSRTENFNWWICAHRRWDTSALFFWSYLFVSPEISTLDARVYE